MNRLVQIFPVAGQLTLYSRDKLSSDLVAALLVSLILIPQSLAYAMLAGLPPELGLYASTLPIVIYALFGSSTTLAVGPVAIASIMTASALGSVSAQGIIDYIDGAIMLALLSGAFLTLLGIFRFGFIANFLSHSVVAGFITASGFLIAISQLKHIVGVDVSGHTFYTLVQSLLGALSNVHVLTMLVGSAALLFLLIARRWADPLLRTLGLSASMADLVARAAPAFGLVITTVVVATMGLDKEGVAIVGEIPVGFVSLGLPSFSFEAAKALALPAVFISIIGYVESISVGRTLATKRQEKLDPNQELIGLGGANVASGLVGAFPVTGGLARSVVNFDAGAKTQLAGIYTAIGITLSSFFLTPFLYYLPTAMLAATIIVAVLSLIDLSIVKRSWNFSKSDFVAVLTTFAVTLLFGIESGVASGIVASILLHLYHTSTPHIAEIGILPDCETFRNVKHYSVQTGPTFVSLRIDESLLFTNVNYLEEYVDELLRARPDVKDIVLHCGAINTIDLSALEMLEALNVRMLNQGVKLHLSELKIPVKKLLEKANFIEQLGGTEYLSQYEAFQDLQSKV